MTTKRNCSLKGFGLLEILIASAIVSMAMVSLSFVFVLSQRMTARSGELMRANFIAEEGIEAMRFLRDKSWSANMATLAEGTTYYISLSTTTSSWSMGTSNLGNIDGVFNRTIQVQSVMRNGSDDIVLSGGTIDTNTLKIISNVSWSSGSASAETYLSNIFNN